MSVYIFRNCKNKKKSLSRTFKKVPFQLSNEFSPNFCFDSKTKFRETISFSRKDFSLFNPNTKCLPSAWTPRRKKGKRRKKKTWKQTNERKEKEKKSGKIETKARGKLENVKTERHRYCTHTRVTRTRQRSAGVRGRGGRLMRGWRPRWWWWW